MVLYISKKKCGELRSLGGFSDRERIMGQWGQGGFDPQWLLPPQNQLAQQAQQMQQVPNMQQAYAGGYGLPQGPPSAAPSSASGAAALDPQWLLPQQQPFTQQAPPPQHPYPGYGQPQGDAQQQLQTPTMDQLMHQQGQGQVPAAAGYEQQPQPQMFQQQQIPQQVCAAPQALRITLFEQPPGGFVMHDLPAVLNAPMS